MIQSQTVPDSVSMLLELFPSGGTVERFSMEIAVCCNFRSESERNCFPHLEKTFLETDFKRPSLHKDRIKRGL